VPPDGERMTGCHLCGEDNPPFDAGTCRRCGSEDVPICAKCRAFGWLGGCSPSYVWQRQMTLDDAAAHVKRDERERSGLSATIPPDEPDTGPPEHQDAGADEYREWDMKDEDYRIASTRPPWPDSETEPPNPTDNPTEGFDYDAADEAIRDDFADDAERDVLMGWDMFADDDDLEVLDGWRRKAR